MVLEERYRRTALIVGHRTDNDDQRSEDLHRAVDGELKKFRKLDKNGIKSISGWAGMLEDTCLRRMKWICSTNGFAIPQAE